MATHSGGRPVIFSSKPIDPDSSDWVFFIYDDWLRENEAISSHAAIVEGGAIVTDSIALDSYTDVDGVVYTSAYGVKVSPSANFTSLSVTHRISTAASVSGSFGLGRTNIDHTAIIPISEL